MTDTDFCDADEDRKAFVAGMRKVANTIAIIATRSNGECRGLAVTAWCSVSADPPTLLVCVNTNASAHDYIIRQKAFTLNILSSDDKEIVEIFSGQRNLSGQERFEAHRWMFGKFEQPLLLGAIASFECELTTAQPNGSHSIIVARIQKSHLSDEESPLIYLAGAFA